MLLRGVCLAGAWSLRGQVAEQARAAAGPWGPEFSKCGPVWCPELAGNALDLLQCRLCLQMPHSSWVSCVSPDGLTWAAVPKGNHGNQDTEVSSHQVGVCDLFCFESQFLCSVLQNASCICKGCSAVKCTLHGTLWNR